MAVTYNELNTMTRDLFIPVMIDNIFSSNVLLARLKDKSYRLVDGGAGVSVPVSYAKNTSTQWFTGLEAFSTTSNDQITKAFWDYHSIVTALTIADQDILDNSGKDALMNLVKEKITLAEESTSDALGTAIFTGTNAIAASGQIEGLRLACNTSGTYGGIARASNSWWNGQLDATTTTISTSGFIGLYQDCTVDAKKPTVAITTSAIYETLANAATAVQRFVDADVAKLGFTGINVNGIPVLVDSHCPAGHLFLLNEKTLELVVNKKSNFTFDPFIKSQSQAASVGRIFWRGAMVMNNPRLNGMFTSIA